MPDAPVPAAPAAHVSSPPGSSGGTPAGGGAAPHTGGGQSQTQTPPPAQGSQSAAEMEVDLVVNGRQEKWPLSKAKQRLQMELAAEKKFHEAKKLRDDAEAREKRYKDDPWAVFEGLDPAARRAKLEERLWEEMQSEQMSPEQRRVRELESQLRERETAEQKRQEETRQAELQHHTARARAEYAQKFATALKASGIAEGTPAAARAVQRMAIYERENHELEQPVATVEQLAELVRDEYSGEVRDYFGGREGDSLLEAMGEELVAKTLKAAAARFKARQQAGSQNGARTPTPGAVTSANTQPGQSPRRPNGQFAPQKERLTQDDWRLSYTERKSRGLL